MYIVVPWVSEHRQQTKLITKMKNEKKNGKSKNIIEWSDILWYEFFALQVVDQNKNDENHEVNWDDAFEIEKNERKDYFTNGNGKLRISKEFMLRNFILFLWVVACAQNEIKMNNFFPSIFTRNRQNKKKKKTQN